MEGPSGPRYFGVVLRRRSSRCRPRQTVARRDGRKRTGQAGQLRQGVDLRRPAGSRPSVRPPCECVESVRRTLFQPCTRMSGWWFAASASSATRLTKAIARGEVGEASARARSQRASVRCQSRRAQPLLDLRVGEQCHPPSRLARSRDAYSQSVRIVSLVPHATELLFALGPRREVVAVTHECDHPPAAARAAAGHPRRAARRAERGGDRRGGARAHARGRGDLRARPRGARGARARADRHPGAVPGVRGLLRGGRRACPRAALAPAGDRARPEDAGRDPRRRTTRGPGDRQSRGGRRARRALGGPDRPGEAGRARSARSRVSPRWSGSTRCTWRATGLRS